MEVITEFSEDEFNVPYSSVNLNQDCLFLGWSTTQKEVALRSALDTIIRRQASDQVEYSGLCCIVIVPSPLDVPIMIEKIRNLKSRYGIRSACVNHNNEIGEFVDHFTADVSDSIRNNYSMIIVGHQWSILKGLQRGTIPINLLKHVVIELDPFISWMDYETPLIPQNFAQLLSLFKNQITSSMCITVITGHVLSIQQITMITREFKKNWRIFTVMSIPQQLLLPSINKDVITANHASHLFYDNLCPPKAAQNTLFSPTPSEFIKGQDNTITGCVPQNQRMEIDDVSTKSTKAVPSSSSTMCILRPPFNQNNGQVKSEVKKMSQTEIKMKKKEKAAQVAREFRARQRQSTGQSIRPRKKYEYQARQTRGHYVRIVEQDEVGEEEEDNEFIHEYENITVNEAIFTFKTKVLMEWENCGSQESNHCLEVELAQQIQQGRPTKVQIIEDCDDTSFLVTLSPWVASIKDELNSSPFERTLRDCRRLYMYNNGWMNWLLHQCTVSVMQYFAQNSEDGMTGEENSILLQDAFDAMSGVITLLIDNLKHQLIGPLLPLPEKLNKCSNTCDSSNTTTLGQENTSQSAILPATSESIGKKIPSANVTNCKGEFLVITPDQPCILEKCVKTEPVVIRGVTVLHLSKIAKMTASELDRVAGRVTSPNCEILFKDLSTLLPNKWLNDSIILALLASIHNRSKTMPEARSFIFLDSLNTKRTINGIIFKSRRGRPSFLVKSISQIPQTKLLIMPFNLLGTHWLLFIADYDALTVSAYDPYESHGQRVTDQTVKESLESIATSITKVMSQVMKKNNERCEDGANPVFTAAKTYISDCRMPKQTRDDTNECGLYILCFLELFINSCDYDHQNCAKMGSTSECLQFVGSKAIRDRYYYQVMDLLIK